jgi:DNA repair exonuclease SbcCD nuclease subunit
LEQLITLDINTLFIAGDLFQKNLQDFSDFDSIWENSLKEFQIHIIPGNHDTNLSAQAISVDNVFVYTKPELVKIAPKSLPVLFIPYLKQRSMGEQIAEFKTDLEPGNWILVGHGDWIESMNEYNPYEPGIYMPLTRVDIESFSPICVCLGHIHKPLDLGCVHYPGSPLGLDVTETGPRRFLILDSESGECESCRISPDVIYLDETITVFPTEDEEQFLEAQVEALKNGWQLAEKELVKCLLRLRVRGYTKDRRKIARLVCEMFKDMKFYKGEEPDISELLLADDIESEEIAKRVIEKISEIEWPAGQKHPHYSDIVMQALRVIYGTEV